MLTNRNQGGRNQGGGNISSRKAGEEAQTQRRPRGAKYTKTEIDKLLDLIEERLPTGGEDWDGK